MLAISTLPFWGSFFFNNAVLGYREPILYTDPRSYETSFWGLTLVARSGSKNEIGVVDSSKKKGKMQFSPMPTGNLYMPSVSVYYPHDVDSIVVLVLNIAQHIQLY